MLPVLIQALVLASAGLLSVGSITLVILLITEKIVITLLVVLVFCLSVIIPIVIYISFPKRAKDLLNGVRQALNRHSRPIGIGAPLVFGLIILIKGITDLL